MWVIYELKSVHRHLWQRTIWCPVRSASSETFSVSGMLRGRASDTSGLAYSVLVVRGLVCALGSHWCERKKAGRIRVAETRRLRANWLIRPGHVARIRNRVVSLLDNRHHWRTSTFAFILLAALRQLPNEYNRSTWCRVSRISVSVSHLI